MSGKGSQQRPTDRQKYADNWDRIFSKPDESVINKETQDQIAAIMLMHGNQEQQRKALAYASSENSKLDLSKCKKCNGDMVPGKAIVQTYTGLPDFAGDTYPVTLSAGGDGKLVNCSKCKECGWSTT